MRTVIYAALAAGIVAPSAAVAQTISVNSNKTVSGSSHGMSWTAQSLIVGQTSTATIAGGGNPIYLAPNQNGYSGVVGMLMQYDNGSAFVCSGSLLSDRRSILTAAHCVSNGFSSNVNGRAPGLVNTSVFFYDGMSSGVDPFIYNSPPGVTTIGVSNYFVNSAYTGQVIDQNDIAVLRLATEAPAFAQGYELYTAGDLTGDMFNVAGYGTRSVVGGAEGVTGPGEGAGVGRRRQGDNIFDYRWGDDAFAGFFTDEDAAGDNFFGSAKIDFSFISDFDNGTAPNDTSCRIALAVAGGAGAQFCNTGLGAMEVGTAGGDSGGPQFINGKIASVTSYGLTFGTGFGDFKPGLQSSWGEFNGFVPTYIHTSFITSAVPEPSTWAMMIVGFGAIGGAMRRRSKAQAGTLATA